MSSFTIDSDHNITALVDVPADAHLDDTFSSEKELAKLTADWPMSRLIEAWNGFAGAAPFDDLRPVKRFTSRRIAVSRLWAVAERLGARVTESATSAAPQKAKRVRKATPRTSAQKRPKEAPGNKKAEVIAMMKRRRGVTLAELEAATGWQKHTIRGLVSTLGSKGGLKIESSQSASRERTYRILR